MLYTRSYIYSRTKHYLELTPKNLENSLQWSKRVMLKLKYCEKRGSKTTFPVQGIWLSRHWTKAIFA